MLNGVKLKLGFGSKSDGELIHRRDVHRGEDNQRRGLLHPEAGNEPGDSGGAERAELRDNPPHDLGVFQPAIGAYDPIRGLAASEDANQGGRGRLLGDEHRIGDGELPVRGRRQHLPQRQDQLHRFQIRRTVCQPQEGDGGDLENRRGGFQCLGLDRGELSPAARRRPLQ